MAEKPGEWELVPESLERSESDAKQLELQLRAQACPRDSQKPDRLAEGKNSRSQPDEPEDEDSSPALSPSNLKKNVGVISSPCNNSQAGQKDVVVATSMSTTETQVSGRGSRVPAANDINSADSTATPAAESAVASTGAAFSAPSNWDKVQLGEAPAFIFPNMGQAVCDKHMGGGILHEGAGGEAGRMWNSTIPHGDQRRIPALERELGVQVRDEDGAVDLARARQARRWNMSCFSCREEGPDVTLLPCRHSILCQRCFLDPHCTKLDNCPLCHQQVEGLLFTERMLQFLIHRSNI